MDRFTEIVSLGIFAESTRPEYEGCTINSNRASVYPCPRYRVRFFLLFLPAFARPAVLLLRLDGLVPDLPSTLLRNIL